MKSSIIIAEVLSNLQFLQLTASHFFPNSLRGLKPVDLVMVSFWSFCRPLLRYWCWCFQWSLQRSSSLAFWCLESIYLRSFPRNLWIRLCISIWKKKSMILQAMIRQWINTNITFILRQFILFNNWKPCRLIPIITLCFRNMLSKPISSISIIERCYLLSSMFGTMPLTPTSRARFGYLSSLAWCLFSPLPRRTHNLL